MFSVTCQSGRVTLPNKVVQMEFHHPHYFHLFTLESTSKINLSVRRSNCSQTSGQALKFSLLYFPHYFCSFWNYLHDQVTTSQRCNMHDRYLSLVHLMNNSPFCGATIRPLFWTRVIITNCLLVLIGCNTCLIH